MSMNDISAQSDKTGRHRIHAFSPLRIKVLGTVCTLLGVLATTLIPALSGSRQHDAGFAILTASVVCELISWIAAPIYAWLLVQGFRHTSSRFVYGLRLLVLAVICEIPYELATTGKLDGSSRNPVFALLIALITLCAIDWASRIAAKAARWATDTCIVAAAVAWTFLLNIGTRQQFVNLGVAIIGFAVIFYALAAHENTMIFAAGLLGALCGLTPAIGVVVLHSRDEESQPVTGWPRWAFYAIYPILLVIGALAG